MCVLEETKTDKKMKDKDFIISSKLFRVAYFI